MYSIVIFKGEREREREKQTEADIIIIITCMLELAQNKLKFSENFEKQRQTEDVQMPGCLSFLNSRRQNESRHHASSPQTADLPTFWVGSVSRICLHAGLLLLVC